MMSLDITMTLWLTESKDVHFCTKKSDFHKEQDDKEVAVLKAELTPSPVLCKHHQQPVTQIPVLPNKGYSVSLRVPHKSNLCTNKNRTTTPTCCGCILHCVNNNVINEYLLKTVSAM